MALPSRALCYCSALPPFALALTTPPRCALLRCSPFVPLPPQSPAASIRCAGRRLAQARSGCVPFICGHAAVAWICPVDWDTPIFDPDPNGFSANGCGAVARRWCSGCRCGWRRGRGQSRLYHASANSIGLEPRAWVWDACSSSVGCRGRFPGHRPLCGLHSPLVHRAAHCSRRHKCSRHVCRA